MARKHRRSTQSRIVIGPPGGGGADVDTGTALSVVAAILLVVFLVRVLGRSEAVQDIGKAV